MVNAADMGANGCDVSRGAAHHLAHSQAIVDAAGWDPLRRVRNLAIMPEDCRSYAQGHRQPGMIELKQGAIMSVGEWLRNLGLQHYESVFLENAINTDVLPDLTESDLEKLGVLLGDRKRFIKA